MEGSKMSELDKLEKYLKERGIKYERIDKDLVYDPSGSIKDLGRHQINVLDETGYRLWDAICQYGSYGYERGLLEIYGVLVNEEKDGDCVVGWLTAEDVIKRIEEYEIVQSVKKAFTE